MALTPQEQREFHRLMIDLCLDDPEFMRQLVTRRHGWTRRVRLIRAGGAAVCFIALIALSLSGAVGLAWAFVAAALALAGVTCSVGAVAPFPVPTRARWLRLRLRARRAAHHYHLAILQHRHKATHVPPDGQ
ncbi:hypothetical protein GCM10011492_27680 [Flexivirga endophytica]|uniref:DUF3040 domain-containing protein n=1 Tax=Flexivirga endophytica TaxID=1849103 RepID=A0A916T8D3_9MICO|nr:DUF3040 domain-containing protein [Flexivirga endophytica]GGB35504.1 hypothetical protein GCM10011492_27680 [Flexivirga endophytica]GHB43219.1 hypothetical protein GCM10008112_10060 [Flexivirga endophytica]